MGRGHICRDNIMRPKRRVGLGVSILIFHISLCVDNLTIGFLGDQPTPPKVSLVLPIIISN